ncbi:MAG: universal stress protein [Deltaproteobacteria bacterium]|nr:universal stress protein [Deltaproteobacteria bacterium]MBI4796682.1 universal stress protein [Deltaproteobacteria bacterium]
MQPKILVALDFLAPAPWAVGYAIRLAARLHLPLVFMGVVSAGGAAWTEGGDSSPENLEEAHKQRLEHVVRQCQEEGVVLEILLSSGPFFQGISQVLDSSDNFRFLVMGAPQETPALETEGFLAAMKDLHQRFRGEILLVREQGKVARLADWEQPNRGRKP